MFGMPASANTFEPTTSASEQDKGAEAPRANGGTGSHANTFAFNGFGPPNTIPLTKVYFPYAERDPQSTSVFGAYMSYTSITCLPEYRGFSFEELRLNDIKHGYDGKQASPRSSRPSTFSNASSPAPFPSSSTVPCFGAPFPAQSTPFQTMLDLDKTVDAALPGTSFASPKPFMSHPPATLLGSPNVATPARISPSPSPFNFSIFNSSLPTAPASKSLSQPAENNPSPSTGSELPQQAAAILSPTVNPVSVPGNLAGTPITSQNTREPKSNTAESVAPSPATLSSSSISPFYGYSSLKSCTSQTESSTSGDTPKAAESGPSFLSTEPTESQTSETPSTSNTNLTTPSTLSPSPAPSTVSAPIPDISLPLTPCPESSPPTSNPVENKVDPLQINPETFPDPAAATPSPPVQPPASLISGNPTAVNLNQAAQVPPHNPDNAECIPLALLHPVFGHFIDDLDGFKPTDREYRFLDELSDALPSLDGPQRLDRFSTLAKKYFGIYFGTDTHASSGPGISGVTPLSADAKASAVGRAAIHGNMYITLDLDDPSLKQRYSTSSPNNVIIPLFGTRMNSVTVLRGPCLHIILSDTSITFAGSSPRNTGPWDFQLISRQFLTMSSTIPLNRDIIKYNDSLKNTAARAFGAMTNAADCLKTSYIRVHGNYPTGYPYPRSYRLLKGNFLVELYFNAKLTRFTRSGKLFYRGIEESGEDRTRNVLVQFVRQYCTELHSLCHQLGHATALRAVEKLPGGWFMVVSDDTNIEASSPQAISASIEAELTALVKEVHKKGFVLGNEVLRADNVTVVPSRSRPILVDLEKGGKAGDVRFSVRRNSNGVPHLPEGAEEGDIVSAEDDLKLVEMMGNII